MKPLVKNNHKETMSLLEKLKKAGSLTSSTMAESAFFNNKEEIITDIPALNIALGGKLDGGLTPGTIMVSGPSKSFKTAISLKMVAAYMKKYSDAICLFYDSEYGSTPEYFATYNIDTNKVIHIPIENVEELKFDICKKLDAIEKGNRVIIFIDSIGNTASKKEVEDAKDEKSVADMSRAKALKSLWRIITPKITLKEIPLIAVNHIYMEMGAMYPKAVVGGGCLLPGTKIKIPNGTKLVEEFCIGDEVITKDGVGTVTNVWTPETLIEGTPECFEIEFEDGSIVQCSDSHKFLIDENWVEAKNLVVGDNVETLSA